MSDGSFLERVRARRAEQRAERHIDIDLPGYGGDVVLRFGPVSWEVVQQVADRAQKGKDPRRMLNAQADLLIAACREVLVRVDGEVGPIVEGETVRFDAQLGAALGIPADDARTARSVLFEAFSLANAPDIAVAGVAVELQQWMGETDAEIDQALLGE